MLKGGGVPYVRLATPTTHTPYLIPIVDLGGADSGDMHTEVTVLPATIQADKHPEVGRGPSGVLQTTFEAKLVGFLLVCYSFEALPPPLHLRSVSSAARHVARRDLERRFSPLPSRFLWVGFFT